MTFRRSALLAVAAASLLASCATTQGADPKLTAAKALTDTATAITAAAQETQAVDRLGLLNPSMKAGIAQDLRLAEQSENAAVAAYKVGSFADVMSATATVASLAAEVLVIVHTAQTGAQ